MNTSDVRSAGSAKPPPKDLSHHFSDVTKARAASQMKAFYRFFRIPGITQLAGGSSPLLPSSPSLPLHRLSYLRYRPVQVQVQVQVQQQQQQQR